MRAHAAARATSPALLSWSWLVVQAAARCYLTIAHTLLAVAAVPVIAGWHSGVVMSASMAPLIRPGDLAVSAPLGRTEPVPVGRVIAFHSATASSRFRVVVHRVIAANPDGTYTTKGDANPSADVSHLTRQAVMGRCRLLVPWVGLPILWWMHHDTLKLATWAMLTVAAVIVIFAGRRGKKRRRPPPPPDERRDVVTRPGPRAFAVRPHRVSRRYVRLLVGLAIVAGLLVTNAVGAASASAAAFRATTVDRGNAWTAAARLAQPYTAAVLADAPWGYYPLDDPSGPTMSDSSGNSGRAGTYTAPISYSQNGSGVTSYSKAVTLTGAGARAVAATASAATSAPSTYTIEGWFKTTTTSGGKLFGFESGTGPTSSKFDRTLFMNNGGHLVFGGWSGAGASTITTPASYNDDVWHYVVVTAVPQGSHQSATIYVDGVLAISGSATGVTTYNGYWRIGYGSIGTGAGYPTSANFAGSVDNVAIYTTALTALRIVAHYAAR